MICSLRGATPASEPYILTLLWAILKLVQTYFDSILKAVGKYIQLAIYLRYISLKGDYLKLFMLAKDMEKQLCYYSVLVSSVVLSC